MEFFIRKNSTLPLLKLQFVKDGRSDYHKFMEFIESSTIIFSMVDVETGIPKITSKLGSFVSKTFIDPDTPTEYYIYFKFSKKDTKRVGRYEGQFMLKNSEGNLIVPIREPLFINVTESFISDENCCDEEPSPKPCPECPQCPSQTPSNTPTPTPTPTETETPTPTPTLTETETPTPTPTETETPTPTPTSTPSQEIIDGLITGDGFYIQTGPDEYLKITE